MLEEIQCLLHAVNCSEPYCLILVLLPKSSACIHGRKDHALAFNCFFYLCSLLFDLVQMIHRFKSNCSVTFEVNNKYELKEKVHLGLLNLDPIGDNSVRLFYIMALSL